MAPISLSYDTIRTAYRIYSSARYLCMIDVDVGRYHNRGLDIWGINPFLHSEPFFFGEIITKTAIHSTVANRRSSHHTAIFVQTTSAPAHIVAPNRVIPSLNRQYHPPAGSHVNFDLQALNDDLSGENDQLHDSATQR